MTSTDPDTRLMRGARGGIVVGYNVQVAVDSQHGLIAHHAVTQDASDQNQLAAVAEGAKEALGVEQLDVTADASPLPNGDGLMLLDDEDDVPLRPQDVDRQLMRTARLAALDPDDGIAL